jgi:type II secretory ATPase GspE/PulE/Tfp pilus assembly ATPase PilB-like protein
MANLNILETRQPQDGRFSVRSGGEETDMRVSIIPTADAESIVLRILGKSGNDLSLSGLGLDEQTLGLYRNVLKSPHGLFLLSGPTGSGKTTTLNAMLREIVSEKIKIVSIEDPVEYKVDGVNQIQTNEALGLDFGTLLRRVLRHDPNVIMLGEIRDAETAKIAVRAALTGHLVLSPLHTNDAAGLVPRLIDMGVEPYLLASVLRGASAQRLIRKICPHCRREREATAHEKKLFAAAGLRGALEARNGMIAEGVGCPVCQETGYKGRVLVVEAFRTDKETEEQIAVGKRRLKVKMKTLFERGMEASLSGLTTPEEVEKEIMTPGESGV